MRPKYKRGTEVVITNEKSNTPPSIDRYLTIKLKEGRFSVRGLRGVVRDMKLSSDYRSPTGSFEAYKYTVLLVKEDDQSKHSVHVFERDLSPVVIRDTTHSVEDD